MNPAVLAALGPLGSLIDEDVRDICVGGDGRVWCRKHAGFTLTDLILTPREARRIGAGLVDMHGGRVDDAKPIGDAALAGSLRAHVVLPPAARDGTLVTIRFPRSTPVTIDDYRVPPGWDWDAVADESILVTGATGSGKTTLVDLLVSRIPPDERVLVIEDIAEMSLRHPHVASLVTRASNAEGAGAIPLGMLVRESLRMSPDRIIVGEVRGAEIVDLVMALTSGHRGLTTIHARTRGDVPERLVALGLVAGLQPDTIARLIPVAFDRVVHCTRTPDGFSLTTSRFRRNGDELEVGP